MRRIVVAFASALAICGVMHRATAQTSDPRADFEVVDKIGTRRAYEIFLDLHRTGPYADAARKRLQGLDLKRTQPNWGDEIFIPRLMDRQK